MGFPGSAGVPPAHPSLQGSATAEPTADAGETPALPIARPSLGQLFQHLAGSDLPTTLYLAPAGLSKGSTPAGSYRLAGGSLSFLDCRVVCRAGPGRVVEAVAAVPELLAAARDPALRRHVESLLHRLTAPRPPFAGLSLDRPLVMGIVNVTPDSFSDGGRHADPDAAIAHGLALREAGADILDVGGESTRPGSAPVEPEEEMRRVLPVVRALAEAGATVSVDTRHAAVMAAALQNGAAIINDITALAGEPEALPTAAAGDGAVVLMHIRGEPRTMQQAPQYDVAPLDVYDRLAERLQVCRAAGIPDHRLCVDPGIGFGKTVEHNLQILGRLALYHGLGVPLLLGVSRKAFIGRVSRDEPADRRLAGSLAAALAGLDQGVQIVRVHDVAETAQAFALWRRIAASGWTAEVPS